MVARAHRIGAETGAGLADHPAILGEIDAAIERANDHLARVEQIKRFHIVADEWQPGSDELTRTMKLRRRAISKKFAAAIDALYAATPSA